MTPGGLVAAYASDSDEDVGAAEVEHHAPRAPATPDRDGADVTRGEAASSSSLFLNLPPPQQKKVSAKRQILVEAAAPAPAADKETAPKRPRMALSGEGASHGLLSMLPAPTNAGPRPQADRANESAKDSVVDDDVRLVLHDTGDAGDSDDKGNEDFRKMLGLAPKAPSSAPAPKPVKVVAAAPVAPAAVHDAAPAAPAASTRAPAISAAPDVPDRAPSPSPPPEEDDADRYKGWQQDLDGSWYPVTPEAHAVYAAWAAAHAQSAAAAAAVPRNAHAATFDAQAELQRSAPAAAPAPVESRPRPDNQVSERLKTDKFVNMRARNKGQLTSLLAMAHENRSALEERWSQGRAKMRENKKRYGF